MAKIVPEKIIATCVDCPYYDDDRNDVTWCNNIRHAIWNFISDFPKWCPLQDTPEPKEKEKNISYHEYLKIKGEK